MGLKIERQGMEIRIGFVDIDYGYTMRFDEAVTFADQLVAALYELVDLDRGVDPEALTHREVQAATLAAAGMSDKRIAELMTLSPNSVHAYLRSVYRKLGIRSRKDLPLAMRKLREDYEQEQRSGVL